LACFQPPLKPNVRTVDAAAALFQWLGAPVVAAAVSVAYFRSSKNMGLGERLAVSAHGVAIVLVYVGALLVAAFGLSRASLLYPFWSLFLLPLILVAVALVRFKGNGAVHLLQLANLLSAGWSLFVGTMAVTGDWL
jgi:F0F1-type ATP synthase assembly protein I